MDRRKRFLRFSCMVRLFCWSTDPRVKCVQGNNMDRCTGCSQRRSHTPQHLKCKKHFLLSSEILVQSKFGFVLQKITWSYDTITTHGKVIIIWNVILPNKTVPGKGGRLSSWHQASWHKMRPDIKTLFWATSPTESKRLLLIRIFMINLYEKCGKWYSMKFDSFP